MQRNLLALLLLAFIGFGAQATRAETNTISNAQLGQLVAAETITSSYLTIVGQYESILSQPTLPHNTVIAVEASSISYLDQVAQREQVLSSLYQEAKVTSIIPLQTVLVSQLIKLDQEERALLPLYQSPNKSVVIPELISVLATEHEIASLFLQKQALLSTLPGDLLVQSRVQYTSWSKIIAYDEVRIQLALQ